METKYPPIPEKIWQLQVISNGVSGIVLKISDTAVVKIALGEENRPALDTEYAIYQRLGHHPSITKLFYQQNGMLVLERLQYPLRKRLHDLSDMGKVPPTTDILRWALQITDALHYVHSCGILQVDIGAHNALLDWEDNLKLCDFAGSSIDGSTPTVFPSRKSQNPNIPDGEPSVQSEIFALGSMLYEVETTKQPYHDKSDSDVTKLFSRGDFPDVSTLILGNVIARCWKLEYERILEIMNDVKLIWDKI